MEDRELYEILNGIIVEHGVQAGPGMFRDAFYALGIWHWNMLGNCPAFPDRLERHREWLEKLSIGKADQISLYMARASSLAYRYLRKKRRTR